MAIISGIYSINNVLNGKCYVGSSNDVYKRFNEHIKALKKGVHKNYKLQKSWNKNTEINFSFNLLECIEKSKLLEREQYWIDNKKSYLSEFGYNINKDANRPDVKDIFNNWLNQFGEEEALRKLAMWRKKHDDAVRGKSVNKGNKRDDLGLYNTLNKTLPIVQFDLDGVFIKEWSGIRIAARQLEISPTGISRTCKKILKTSGGFIWKYK